MKIHNDFNIKNAINDYCPWSYYPIQDNSLTTDKGQIVGFVTAITIDAVG